MNKLNEFLSNAGGKFLGFTVQNSKLTRHFAGKVAKVTDKYVVVVESSNNKSGRATKYNKGSIVKVVGFNGLEYNKK